MGIKTKFNPMGGISKNELSLWRYSNDIISGKTLLYNYIGKGRTIYAYLNISDLPYPYTTIFFSNSVPPNYSDDLMYYNGANLYPTMRFVGYAEGYNSDFINIQIAGYSGVYTLCRVPRTDTILTSWPELLKVPDVKGKAIINEWYNYSNSGSDVDRRAPFYNNENITKVDLQNVPFINNNMSKAFYNCQNLTEVQNISSSVTNMSNAFYNCINLNQSMYRKFYSTDILKANDCFANCVSITNMAECFCNCGRLTSVGSIIPRNVTNIYKCFYNCNSLTGTIYIDSTEITNCAYYSPANTSRRRDIRIYFNYQNGVATKTYNTFRTAPAYTTSGAEGSTNALANRRNTYVYNRGKAPW